MTLRSRPAARRLGVATWLVFSLSTARGYGAPSISGAHGIAFSPSQAGALLVRTPYGVFHSRDGGQTADFLCDEVMTAARDAPAEVVFVNGGALLASRPPSWLTLGLPAVLPGTPTENVPHLARSEDGCNWQTFGTEGELSQFAVDPSHPERVLAVGFGIEELEPSDSGEPRERSRARLMLSTDAGESFARLLELPPETTPLSVVIAPSNSERVYVAAWAQRSEGTGSRLLVSSDGGSEFREFALPGGERLAARVVAVHPLRENRVYLQLQDSGETQLLVSDDAGETFRSFFTGAENLTGFAIADDGRELYFGSRSGTWAARGDGSEPERRSELAVTCLAYGDFALFACPSDSSPYALARSTDGGRSFTHSLRFADTCGSSGCSEGTDVQLTCPAVLPEIASTLEVKACAPSSGWSDGTAGAGYEPAQVSRVRARGGCQFGYSAAAASGWAGWFSAIVLWSVRIGARNRRHRPQSRTRSPLAE
ncbi:MAG TPA: hypothetical protein VFQ61_33125 [Polyangiaceae bacterium]|nr:hypothetical protein [Polyangiaceae bacterium]